MAAEVGARRFEGMVAIVTGSSSNPGIGRACARRLALEGASVVINGRSEEQLLRTESELRGEGLSVVAVSGSMESDETPVKLVETALHGFGGIDAIVNVVGGHRYRGPLYALDRQALLATFDLNVWPSMALIREAMKNGLAVRPGSIVNISSGAPRKTTPALAAYAAAKAALNAMTRTYARDLAPTGVRINAVSPGLTRTMATRQVWEDDGGAAAAREVPLGRLTEADDVAAATAFLLSGDARQITGIVLDIDAGNHLLSGGWSPALTSSASATAPDA